MLETLFDDQLALIEWLPQKEVTAEEWEQSHLAIRHYLSQSNPVKRALITSEAFKNWESFGKVLVDSSPNSFLAQQLEKVAIVTDLPTFDVGHALRDQYPEATIFIYCQDEIEEAKKWLMLETVAESELKPQPT